ncbi:MAG: hypothetical protein DMD26_07640 [Gemmatimonadetes bacterium]|nr:MAG: hypothetical protein DMD26_07640 [Gemmatimonadota bacterium]
MDRATEWEEERASLLGRRISDLGLQIRGSRVERLVDELYRELEVRSISFRPPVYLSDQWGCPDGTPLIGVPFYLVDRRLERLEAEMSGSVEDDVEAMRYLRHECGHAVNYAFHLYERADWRRTFGAFSQPYRERYRADPFSRAHVRHILGWYAQKHPDEDDSGSQAIPITDARQFDNDLRRIFATPADAPSGMLAGDFIERHTREILVRLSYWTGEPPAGVRSLLDHLIARSRALGLRVSGLEAATLIELTAFGTAVVMNYRHTQSLGRAARTRARREEIQA